MTIQIDSRKVKPGDVFVAIKGQHEDGNKYAVDALNNGASLVIVDDSKYINNNDKRIVYVKSSIEELKRLGKNYLNHSNIKTLIGITGSCGKTTTRTWIDYILSKNIETCSSIENYNTIIGLPICLSNIKPSTSIGIFELGTNSYGEIHALSTYLNPTVGIITNIYESHIGMFSNFEELASEKISIIDGIKNSGLLLYDGDCNFANIIENKCKERNIKPISVGFGNNCDYKVEHSNNEIIVQHNKISIKYQIDAIGKHYAYISALIVALIDSIGLDINYYKKYFNELKPLGGRGIHKQYQYNNKHFTVIDETYNASPSSMIANLEVLNNYDSKKVIVIGEMLELGQYSEKYHNKIADVLSNIQNKTTYFIGNRNLHKIMNKYNNVICYTKISTNIVENILNTVNNGDILFIKGSHSIKLDLFIKYLDNLTLNDCRK
ncbi:MAG: UDP-N-acetylmuramoyl-tripeptide--D-alanyl-D-alanine ligase [Alphaproteobacteria bacterium]|nr:UDP-N-acetylmuramoyl-tripeptide--D-alanyl-D-alanine ligase [Alphaproteobacteria bacterium]